MTMDAIDSRKAIWITAGIAASLALVVGGVLPSLALDELKADLRKKDEVIWELKARLIDSMAKGEGYRGQLEHLTKEHAQDRDLLFRLNRTLEGVKWQMDMVVKTCPGRTRPPKLWGEEKEEDEE